MEAFVDTPSGKVEEGERGREKGGRTRTFFAYTYSLIKVIKLRQRGSTLLFLLCFLHFLFLSLSRSLSRRCKRQNQNSPLDSASKREIRKQGKKEWRKEEERRSIFKGNIFSHSHSYFSHDFAPCYLFIRTRFTRLIRPDRIVN